MDSGDINEDLCGELTALTGPLRPQGVAGPLRLDSQGYILIYYVRHPMVAGKQDQLALDSQLQASHASAVPLHCAALCD